MSWADDIKKSFEDLAKSFAPTEEERQTLEQAKANEALNAANSGDIQNALNSISGFANKYRDYLGNQRDMAIQNLDNARNNAFQNIMANANTAGMMYSNFPERSKYQYNTATYLPARTKIEDTYNTGLDALKSNVVKMANSLAEYNDEIASLNKRSQSSSSSNSDLPVGAYSLNDSGDYLKRRATDNGTNFFNSKGEPVRFGTTLRHSGITDTEGILDAALYVLDEDAGNWLKDIYNTARANGYGNIVINAGDDFEPIGLDFLSDAEKAFMDSLGLSFAQ